MTPYYIDTSSILPYYRDETHSQLVQDFLLSLSAPVVISHLTEVEFASALSRLVRISEIDDAQAGLIEETFYADIKSGLFRRVSFTVSNFHQAIKWLSLRNTALRTLDALHLAVSYKGGFQMVTCDDILAKSANKLKVPHQYLLNNL
ncbi:MAG: type II toxin-antitoxin system VapC family toxin [Gammaproteobacteria bacterium]|nr:type II toxin-antitoxin system VapC family toxin [Gammaproteobacteria bacterium]